MDDFEKRSRRGNRQVAERVSLVHSPVISLPALRGFVVAGLVGGIRRDPDDEGDREKCCKIKGKKGTRV